MITSNQILHLFEKYENTFNINREVVEIFVNPTVDELKSIKGKLDVADLRFIADPKSKKVYEWYALTSIHAPVAERLHLSGHLDILYGLAKYSGGSAPVMFRVDSIEYYVRNIKSNMHKTVMLAEIFEAKWEWLDSYIRGSSAYVDIWHKKYNSIFGYKN